MTRAAMCAEPRAPAIEPTVTEQAVAADELRIAIELVDTVIRDLFGVGLTLHSALPHISGRAEQPVTVAIDGIDRIIRTIRDVVFDLAETQAEGRPH
jgi:signal transduction histidine kinase